MRKEWPNTPIIDLLEIKDVCDFLKNLRIKSRSSAKQIELRDEHKRKGKVLLFNINDSESKIFTIKRYINNHDKRNGNKYQEC